MILLKSKSYNTTLLLKILLSLSQSLNWPTRSYVMFPHDFSDFIPYFSLPFSPHNNNTGLLFPEHIRYNPISGPVYVCIDVTLFRRLIKRPPYLKLQDNATPPTLAFPIPPYLAFLLLFSIHFHLVTFYVLYIPFLVFIICFLQLERKVTESRSL